MQEALKQGVFHSISAFCTAGFSLFSNNLIGYCDDYFVNLVIVFTSYLGSLGFYVIYDLSSFSKKFISKKNKHRLSTHTKLVLTVSVSMIIAGTLFLILSESVNPLNNNCNIFLLSFFQAGSSASSVGFNTVNIGTLSNASLFFITFLCSLVLHPAVQVEA